MEQPDVYIHEDMRVEEWTTKVPILEMSRAEGFLNGKQYYGDDMSWESVAFDDYIHAFNTRTDKSHLLQEFISAGYYYAYTYRADAYDDDDDAYDDGADGYDDPELLRTPVKL